MIETSEIRYVVIEKLKNDIQDMAIEPFPNNPRNYRLTHPKGAVLIAFDGLNMTEPHTVQQIFTLSLTATILFNSIIDSSEMLSDIDRIRQSVTNDLFPYGSRFYCVNQVPLGEEENVWYYRLKFILPGVIIQGD